MDRKRCASCGDKLYPPKNISNQRYCTKKECQRVRNRRWKAKNPRYWIRYRQKKSEPHKENTRRIKISIEESILANLTKNGESNCLCQITLKPRVKRVRMYGKSTHEIDNEKK